MALTNVTKDTGYYSCTAKLLSNGEPITADWLQAQCRINVAPNYAQTEYIVKVSVQYRTQYTMAWNGDSTMRATVTWIGVDGSVQTKSASANFSNNMHISANGDWKYSDMSVDVCTFNFATVGADKIIVNLDIDLRRTGCSNASCGLNGNQTTEWGGPHWNSKNAHFQHFYINNTIIDVTEIPLGNKPATPTLTNNNKYNNNTGISASTNSLTIGVSSSDWGKPDNGKIFWSCSNGAKGELAKTSQFNINGLSPGTSYTVTVYLKNTIGSSGSASITIRTRHNPPKLTLTIDSVDLEKINLSWTSDKDLADAQYQVDGGSWVKTGVGKSGTFTAKWFDPKTAHTIVFWGRSTATYDSLETYTEGKSATTLDRAHITSIGDCTFGLAIKINIASESTKPLQLEIWTEGNELSPRFTFDVSKGTFTFNPTQDQLDKMYRCYPKSNEVPIKFLLTTKGEWKNWPDTQQDKTLLLTGIAKTQHVGVNNSARRCQVWWGDENNTPRRAVSWVGDSSNNSRRTI